MNTTEKEKAGQIREKQECHGMGLGGRLQYEIWQTVKFVSDLKEMSESAKHLSGGEALLAEKTGLDQGPSCL
jgi:hypothetical protein